MSKPGAVRAAAEMVAFLFSDVEGSTRLLASLGADTFGEVLTDYRDAVAKAAAVEDGRVVDREGDGLFLVFPTAAAALRAAHRAQTAVAQRTWPGDATVAVRMGIHAGEALRHGDGWVGLSVHRAARVASAAHGGQVLVSETARALAADDMPSMLDLRDLGRQRLKDLERDERLYQLVAPGLRQHFPPLWTLDATPNNLPAQPTSFVGRTEELATVARLLADNRLVTLTGVGGAGKSRLALQSAANTLEDYPDGLWLVELAPLTDPAGVVGALASVLGIREDGDRRTDSLLPEDRLIERLVDRRVLLLLDNCEHLLDEVGRLADVLLRSCPNIRILATSREGLGIGGETTWRIPSLSLPPTDPSPDDPAGDAMRLFTDRARAVMPGFELTAATTPAVARICRRLDGIPLAIELAAARVRGLAVEQLAARLDDSFGLLRGGSRTALPRQQTLEAAIDWSYQLLTGFQRIVFARLAVFSGGFTLEAAEEICAGGEVDEADVMELILDLVDKSLVTPVEGPSGPSRYRLLETLRQFALVKLNESGEAGPVRHRHRDRFLRLANDVDDNLHGPELLDVSERVAAEDDNLQAALDWSMATDAGPETAAIAAALGWHAALQGRYRQAVDHLRTALDHGDFQAEAEKEAILRVWLANNLFNAGETDEAELEAQHARDLLAVAAPSRAKVRAMTRHANLLRLSVTRGREEAIDAAHEAVETAEALGDAAALADSLRALGSALGWAGEIDEAAKRLRESLAISKATNDRGSIATTYGHLFVVLHDLHHREEESTQLRIEVEAWLESTPDDTGWSVDLWGFIGYELLRVGDWTGVEAVLDRVSRYHIEGFVLAWLHQIRGALRWMQGRLAEASADARELRRLSIPRWNHDLFPLQAEIAAADGRLDDVRALAEEYLAKEVDASEEHMKVAVLAPLARAEADAALAATADARAEHVRRASDAVARADDLMERYPPATSGSVQFEAADIYLQLARAELSRVTEPDPEVWRRIIAEAWYSYTRLYARWRLAEALFASGHGEEATTELEDAQRLAMELGAGLIAKELGALRRTQIRQ